MNAQTRRLAHGLVFALALVLLVGGIVTRKPGATVVGLIVAAVSWRQWRQWSKQRAAGQGRAQP